MTPALPIAPHWYHARRLDARTTLITEPHVHPIFSANMHLVEGRDRDLLIDSGMGIAPLADFVDAQRRCPDKPVTLLSTHTHVDHIGAAHEFADRLVHPLEIKGLSAPAPYSLCSNDIPGHLRAMFLKAGYPPLWDWLVNALPYAGYALHDYELRAAPATGTVRDGDVIDLGDWQGEVLHLPGHSPGQIGVFHAQTGTLFGGDAVYDGPLIFDGAGMSIADYTETLLRLRGLDVSQIHGGHDPAFDAARLHRICDRYLKLWQ
ncbi:MAG: glyoxylase-like metal-dependent hydrolase (beta-lactamase superfamily II) [Paracoccaceae bacterium]|jgi:glyoxylase-like metal-dependent hydrolase (beta-lactamase superfamily II)